MEQYGTIRAYNADCNDILTGYPDKHFDIAIVDPPYGINRFKNRQNTRLNKYGDTSTGNDNTPDAEYMRQLFRVSKNQIIWGYNHLSHLLPPTSEFIFWYKHQPVISYADGELAWTSYKKTAKCFDYPYFGSVNADEIRIHPYQKPVALYHWILNQYAKQGNKLLDTHGGAMSHAIAAHDLGYELDIIEIDKTAYNKAIKRLKWHQRQKQIIFTA